MLTGDLSMVFVIYREVTLSWVFFPPTFLVFLQCDFLHVGLGHLLDF